MTSTTHSNDGKDASRPLRAVIITEEDPFFVYEYFCQFVKDPRLREVLDIQEVLIQAAFRDSKVALVRRMLSFWGLIDFVRVGFMFVWFKLTGRSCRSVLEKAGLSCRDSKNVNSKSCVQSLQEQNLDVILSVAAPQIFKKNLLQTPSWGCINVHSGPLPRYRGMMPTFWQLLNQEEQIGLTVHTMAPEIDGGEILNQVFTDSNPDESLSSLIRRTKRMAATLTLDTLQLIQKGSEQRTPMNIDEGSYFGFPSASDVRSFRIQGGKML